MRAQVSYLDFVIGFAIFIIAVTIFFNHTGSQQQEREINVIQLSEQLLSPGYPQDWNASTALRLGVLDLGEINETKWDQLRAMLNEEPEKTRSLLSAPYDFIIRIEPSRLDQIGSGTSLPDAQSIHRIERIVAYNGTIVRLEVIGWV